MTNGSHNTDYTFFCILLLIQGITTPGETELSLSVQRSPEIETGIYFTLPLISEPLFLTQAEWHAVKR